MQTRLDESADQLQARSAELESERRSHSATMARAEALQRQVGELQAQQERTRTDFSAELEKGRVAIEAANERAAGAERRALREIEQERSARGTAEKQLALARSKLTETERESQAKALEFVSTNTRINAELEAAKGTTARLTAMVDGQAQQLQSAQQQASQFKAEADTLRGLVEQFKPVPAVKPMRAKRRTA